MTKMDAFTQLFLPVQAYIFNSGSVAPQRMNCLSVLFTKHSDGSDKVDCQLNITGAQCRKKKRKLYNFGEEAEVYCSVLRKA
jgi:hypothetical protein